MTIIRNGRKGAPARRRASALSILVLSAFACAIMAAVPAEAAQATVSVLCYHSFLDKKRMDPYCFTIEELASQLMQLKKEGFRFVSVNDVVSGRVTGAKNVLVTIDDGNRSVYEAFQKVFKPNGIRPLLAIYPNIIDKKKYALTWDQLAYLANNGCDIAAHGFFHEKINQELKDKRPAVFRMEIFKSKQVLEEKLNRKVNIFIFPFGLRTDVAVAALKDAGYRYGFTIKRGRIDLPVAGGGDRLFELPRYMVTRTTWKICYSRIMRNAGLKGVSTVAAADVPDRAPMIAVNDSPLAARIDPITRLEEHLGERPAPVSIKLSANEPDKPDKQRHRKKKREERAAIVSEPLITAQHNGNTPKDKPQLLTPAKFITVDRGKGITIAAPIQRVTSSVRRDEPGLDLHNAGIYDTMGPRSIAREDVESADDRAGGPAHDGGDGVVLKGKLDGGGGGYHADMRNRYRKILDGTQKSYGNFLDMIKDKLGRVRSKIRQYVMKNF